MQPPKCKRGPNVLVLTRKLRSDPRLAKVVVGDATVEVVAIGPRTVRCRVVSPTEDRTFWLAIGESRVLVPGVVVSLTGVEKHGASRGQCRLGFTAPDDVKISRAELLEG